MEKYLNINYKKAIDSLTVGQGTAKESGNPYYYIDLKLCNGYQKRIFLNNEQQFAFSNAFDQTETQKQVNAEF